MMTLDTAKEIAAMVEGYALGKTAAEAMMKVGERFTGSMPIADAIAEPKTLTWEAAFLGANLVINSYKEIYTDQVTGRITSLE
jgi:hypothetical protein